jgi:hypothetical protein
MMSGHCRLVLRLVRTILTIALVGVAIPAAGADPTPADTGGLARCAAIAAADSRLACYDALAAAALRGAQTGSLAQTAPAQTAPAQAVAAAQAGTAAEAGTAAQQGAAAPAGLGSQADTAARAGMAVQSGTAGPMTPVASAAAPGSASPAPTAPGPAEFGLSKRQLKAIPEGPDSIQAEISQITEDRLNNVYVVLDNGQTWAFVEPDPRIRPGDSVKIKRASLGSYLMTTPSRHSYRVRRLQ